MANNHLEPNDGNVKRPAKSKRSKRSDQKPISTFRQRDIWIGQMLAADNEVLSASTKLVAVRIALHLNIDKGQCYPSAPTLAKGTGICERHIPRVLAVLERSGWLAITRSPGRASSFHLTTPEPLTRESGVWVPPDSGVRGPLTRESPKQRSNSESVGGAPPPRPADAGRGLGKELVSVAAVGGFENLRAAWPRPWADDDAADRRAFEQARRHASAEDIIAGALRWAAAMEERFLPSLAKWLAARGWEKPPPKKPKLKQRGNGKVDLTELMLKQEAGWTEDDDGNLYNPVEGRPQ